MAASSEAASFMLALMQAGAPNVELLAAKTVDDLVGIAQRHNIPLPALSSHHLGECGIEDVRSPTGGKKARDSSASSGVDPPVVSGIGGQYDGQRNDDGQVNCRMVTFRTRNHVPTCTSHCVQSNDPKGATITAPMITVGRSWHVYVCRWLCLQGPMASKPAMGCAK
jgi:hypothetical protein